VIRGDVYDASLNPVIGSEQAGVRPVVIVSRDSLNAHRPVVVVVPFTSRDRRALLHPGWVPVRGTDAGLGHDSLALCEQVRGVDKSRLRRYRGHVSEWAMRDIDEGLQIVLGLDS
jgi:mRNA interferase MazF